MTGPNVRLTFEMLDTQTENQERQPDGTRPGLCACTAPAPVMAGRWGLLCSVTPHPGTPVAALLVDGPGG